MSGIKVVLVEPQIPPNTGNIARTCVAVGCELHLVKPLGFSLEDKYLKRAGLDYWEDLELIVHENIDDFLEYAKKQGGRLVLTTKKRGKIYSQFVYQEGDFLLFGSETLGLDEELLEKYSSNCITIPMQTGSKIRSLNLSNAVAIVVYEALKQLTCNFTQNFTMKEFG